MDVPEGLDKRLTNVYKVLKHLFDQYTALQGVPADMRPRVSVHAFLRWVGEDSPDAYAIGAELEEVPVEAIAEVKELLQGPDAVGRIAGLWPYMLFGGTTTKNKLKAINVATLLQFEDGTVAPLAAYAHKDLTTGDLDDAAVMSIMTTYPPQVAQLLTTSNLDDMYERHVNTNRGLFDYAVFAALEEAINNSPADGTMRHRMANLVSFVMGLLPDKLPDIVVQQYGKDKPNPGRHSDPGGGPTGGWSLPQD
jgi:hypothetical protein